MESKQIRKILNARISFVQPSTDWEKGHFTGKPSGNFYTIGLMSGQVFVGYIPEKEEKFTLRTLEGSLPQLKQVQWTRIDSVSDLNYQTKCVFREETSPEEKEACMSVLQPKRNYSKRELTMIAFKYYHYHPILERLICLQQAHQAYQVAQMLLAERKVAIQSLLISRKQQELNQQQTKGEKQNVRN